MEDISSANALLGLRLTESDIYVTSSLRQTLPDEPEVELDLDGASSVDEQEESLRVKWKGTKYRCRQCGQVKANHVCGMLEEVVNRNTVATQVEPVSLAAAVSIGGVLHPVKTITVGKSKVSGTSGGGGGEEKALSKVRPGGLIPVAVASASSCAVRLPESAALFQPCEQTFVSIEDPQAFAASKKQAKVFQNGSVASSSTKSSVSLEDESYDIQSTASSSPRGRPGLPRSSMSDHDVAKQGHQEKSRKLQASSSFRSGSGWFGGVLPSHTDSPQQSQPQPFAAKGKEASNPAIETATTSWLRTASAILNFSALEMSVAASGFSYSSSRSVTPALRPVEAQLPKASKHFAATAPSFEFQTQPGQGSSFWR